MMTLEEYKTYIDNLFKKVGITASKLETSLVAEDVYRLMSNAVLTTRLDMIKKAAKEREELTDRLFADREEVVTRLTNDKIKNMLQ